MHLARSIVIVVALALLAGCVSTGPKPYVFEPQEREYLASYYVVGQPYATAAGSCGDLTVSLHPSIVSGTSYMRAFVYYHNTSDEEYLLQPLEVLTLEVTKPDGEPETVEPRSPSEMQRRIDASKNAALYAQALFAGLSAAAVRPTTVSGPSGTYQINDTGAKYAAIADRTAVGMAATEMSSSVLSEAVGRHVLRRHTLFPGGGIAGFVYFPLAGFSGGNSRSPDALSRVMKDRHFALSFESPCGIETIEFVPVEGE